MRYTSIRLFLLVALVIGPRPVWAGEAVVDADWWSYGRDYSEQRFAPLSQIDSDNVSRLGLAWYLNLPEMRSLVSTPLVVDGIMYFSGSYSVVHAVDARSGRLVWRYDPETLRHAGENRKVLWDTNRGLAYDQGRIFVGTGDGRLLSIDSDSGELIWSTRTLDPDTPRTITGAPRAFNGLVIIGHGGADVGPVRGYVSAYNAENGDLRWRFFTVPGNPDDGFENDAMRMAAKTWTGEWWKYGGGGTVWNAITFDPEFNHLYVGTGNGSPWNRKIRSPGGGDNLFLSSMSLWTRIQVNTSGITRRLREKAGISIPRWIWFSPSSRLAAASGKC